MSRDQSCTICGTWNCHPIEHLDTTLTHGEARRFSANVLEDRSDSVRTKMLARYILALGHHADTWHDVAADMLRTKDVERALQLIGDELGFVCYRRSAQTFMCLTTPTMTIKGWVGNDRPSELFFGADGMSRFLKTVPLRNSIAAWDPVTPAVGWEFFKEGLSAGAGGCTTDHLMQHAQRVVGADSGTYLVIPISTFMIQEKAYEYG